MKLGLTGSAYEGVRWWVSGGAPADAQTHAHGPAPANAAAHEGGRPTSASGEEGAGWSDTRRDDAGPADAIFGSAEAGAPAWSRGGRSLSVERLSASYGGLAVLKEVSLCVNPGELVALIGPNGAGKTTLLRAVSGLLASTGRIQLGDSALQGLSPRQIVRAGVIHCPEGRQLFPDLSVVDNLRLGAHLRHHREAVEADVVQVCELFPVLRARLRQRAASLSGGEQQMLAIARALMGRPAVLMLDEPSFGIAPLVVGQLFEVLRELNAQGLTALVVEQNAQLALGASHRAYVLEDGRIALHGPSDELTRHDGVRTAYLGL